MRPGFAQACTGEDARPHNLALHSCLPTIILFTGQKSGPIAGATFQEVKVWKGSGKAMEVTVSPGGTALRELVTGKGSEGHFLWVCGLFSTSIRSIC
jgi:hypothetical protein